MLTPEQQSEIASLLGITGPEINQAAQDGDEASALYWGAVYHRIANDPQKLAAWDTLFEEMYRIDPVSCKKLIASLKVKSTTLEMMGYERWLRELGPRSFTGTFAPFHHDIWKWYWPITQAQRRGEKLNLEDITYFAPWGRGLGKSTMAEWLAIAEGCLIGTGFVLYVCSNAESAEAHVESIRERLETEPALIATYPGMKKPAGKAGFTGEHKQYGWRQDYLMTANGWAIRPIGLDKAVRGWKRGDTRVTLIILDDIDDDDDGPDIVAKKEKRIAKKILPMGTERTKVVFAQNLIHSGSVLNRMHTRQNNILAVRRGDVPVKSFLEIETVFEQTPTGPRHTIKRAVPSWPDLNMEAAQSFLDRSDLPAFMAEYQHDFAHEQTERVLPEYDDRILKTNLITWSQFIGMYFEGVDNPPKRIPNYWPAYMGGDFGYTPDQHLTAFTWITRAPANAPLSGSIFRYRGRTFSGVSPDDIAMGVRDAMWPPRLPEYEGERKQLIVQSCSHEKAGERLLFNSKYGFYLMTCEKGKEIGIPQWRHFLRADRSQKHPFHRDELQPDGTWKIGRPAWFDIVDDDQFEISNAKDDRGLKVHRDQAYNWKYRKIKLTESGQTVEQPMKVADDTNDSTRQLLTRLGPPILPLTQEEKVRKAIPKGYDWPDLEKKVKAGIILPEQAQMTFENARRRAERFVGQNAALLTDDFGNALAPD